MINAHRMNRADITIAALEVRAEEASASAYFSVDDDARVIAFTEKPEYLKLSRTRYLLCIDGKLYFSTKKLIDVLLEGKSTMKI